MKYLFLLLILIQNTFCFGFQQTNASAFVYHRFGDDRYPSTNIDLDKFEAHLKFFKDNDYLVLTLSQALNELKDQEVGAKVAVITIDDAYKSFYANAWPLLKKYGFPATLYVNTETVGATDFMDWQQLNMVSQLGIEIGNHSHAHPYFLNDFDRQYFLEDLLISHQAFKKNMKQVPNTYAYPYGEWNMPMANLLDSMGYSSAVAQNSGVIYRNAPQLSLPRFPMSNEYADMEQFKEKLAVAALEINNITTYQEGIMGSETSPTIVLSFYEKDLVLKYLQVFIQGTEVNKSITVGKDGLVKLTISPKSSLKKRRTLFTVTVPNRRGEWAWYSYSWVIPKVGQ